MLVRLEEFAKSAPEWDSQLKAFKAVGKQLGQTEAFGTTPKSQCQRIALMLCHDARMPVFEEGFEDDLAVLRPLIGKNWSLITPQNASPLASGSAQRRESVPELTPSEEETALREEVEQEKERKRIRRAEKLQSIKVAESKQKVEGLRRQLAELRASNEAEEADGSRRVLFSDEEDVSVRSASRPASVPVSRVRTSVAGSSSSTAAVGTSASAAPAFVPSAAAPVTLEDLADGEWQDLLPVGALPEEGSPWEYSKWEAIVRMRQSEQGVDLGRGDMQLKL